MGNKVKCNLKNIHAAKLTETVTEGDFQLWEAESNTQCGQYQLGRGGGFSLVSCKKAIEI